MSSFDYDYIVIGGGSGGVSSAKRAAINHKKKVCIIERSRWGGTCVNVGCVPKKIMYQAASIGDMIKHNDLKMYGFGVTANPNKAFFDWAKVKEKRDAYIVRLNTIYENGLKNNGVDIVHGDACFQDAHTIEVTLGDGSGTKTITGDKILIATGGKPMLPTDTPGVPDLCITSDGFFELESLPPKVVVVGAGYIAVELAGVLNSLGSETHLVVRKHKALREFDEEISDFLDKGMVQHGINIHRNTNGVAKIEMNGDKKKVTMKNDEVIDDVDVVLMAPGRVPAIEELGLDKLVGLEMTGSKKICQSR